MPASSVPLWVLTVLMLIGFPALNLIYWPLVLKSGVLSPDADSIAIPMFSGVALTAILTPIVLGTAWACLQRYNSDTKLGALRHDRPIRSALATCLFGGAAILVLAGLAYDLSTSRWSAGTPWYEYIWPTFLLLGVYWLLAMRAALIEQRD